MIDGYPKLEIWTDNCFMPAVGISFKLNFSNIFYDNAYWSMTVIKYTWKNNSLFLVSGCLCDKFLNENSYFSYVFNTQVQEFKKKKISVYVHKYYKKCIRR